MVNDFPECTDGSPIDFTAVVSAVVDSRESESVHSHAGVVPLEQVRILFFICFDRAMYVHCFSGYVVTADE